MKRTAPASSAVPTKDPVVQGSPPAATSPREADGRARRTTVDIYADILEVVKRHGGYGRVTRISYGCGMPVDRLKRFLERLERFGLITTGRAFDNDQQQEGTRYLLTPRGQDFLDTYWKMKGFLDVFGES